MADADTFFLQTTCNKRQITNYIFSLGCALTYVTLNHSLWMGAATYGFVSAFGQNIALIPTLTTAMKWFPNRKGTAMGFVVGGFGGGAMVFNQIQTAIVNYENYKVSEPLCGNFCIFLSLRFYVKSIFGILDVQKLPFLPFTGCGFC